MKKLLILILIVLVLALTIFTIVNGLEIGSFCIWGITKIQKENIALDETVTQASRLANSTFPGKVSEVNTSMKELEQQKNTYQDMVAVSDTGDVQAASQLSNYTLDFLWTKIGTHATSEGIRIDISLTAGTGGQNVYDLNFTAFGSYVGICEFIRDIEDDSDLAFKIEQFSMTTGESTSSLRATFVCKNIPIEGISSIDTNHSANENTTNSTNTNDTNTNNTNTNNANTNSTNTNSTNTNSTNTMANTTNTANNTNTTNTSNQ